MDDTKKRELALNLFREGAIEFSPDGFDLKGHDTDPEAPRSPVYVNLRNLSAPVRTQMGKALADLVQELNLPFDWWAGVPNAGTSIATAYGKATRSLTRAAAFGKDAQKRKIAALQPGSWKPGDRLLLFDDVITGGNSFAEALRQAELAGVQVQDVVIVVDRQQGGARKLAEAGVFVHSLFRLKELLELYLEEELIARETYDMVHAYLHNVSSAS